MRRNWIIGTLIVVLTGLLAVPLSAQGSHDGDGGSPAYHPKIKSFSVATSDITLTYPGYFIDLPDEHTTFLLIPPWGNSWRAQWEDSYLLFGSSRVVLDGNSGAVVLETTDLKNFLPATDKGYAEQVMAAPVFFTSCETAYDEEFDENYAAPGSVLQDPTLPPGNLIMLYEAENHCPGGEHQGDFYATVGFARSPDNGRTWPSPVNSEFGDATRHPILKSVTPEPSAPFPVALGDAIPSGFVDVNDRGEAYLYVTYSYHDGSTGDAAISIRVARAKLGDVLHGFGGDHGFGGQDPPDPNLAPPLQFYKWYDGAFNQLGIGGLDSAVLSTTSCVGLTRMSEITYNDDLGLYMLIFVCDPSSVSNGNTLAAWYYSTATSLDLQDWTTPQPIANSELPYATPCPGQADGSAFDGFYPSFMSPGAPAGHTRLTGLVFFLNGCDQPGTRIMGSRTFAITTEP